MVRVMLLALAPETYVAKLHGLMPCGPVRSDARRESWFGNQTAGIR